METQGQVPSSPTPKTAVDSSAVDSAAVDSAAVDSAAVDSAAVDSAAVDPIACKHPLGNAEIEGFDCGPTDESSPPVKENTALQTVDSAAGDHISGKHPVGNAEAQGFDCAPRDESSPPVKESNALQTAVDLAAGDPFTGKDPLENAEAQGFDCAPTDESSPPVKENTALQISVDSAAGKPITGKHPLGNAEDQGLTDESLTPVKENTALHTAVNSPVGDPFASKHPLGNTEAQEFDCAPTDESSTLVKEITALHTAVDTAANNPISGKQPLGNTEALGFDCAPTGESSPPVKDSSVGDPITGKHPLGNNEALGFDFLPTDESSALVKENTALHTAVDSSVVDSAAGDPIASKHPLRNTEAQGFDCVPTDKSLPPVKENTASPSDAASHYNALLDKIARQVEYYFSDENLPNDKFLLKKMRKDKDGYVPVTVIASFIKMKKLTKDLSIIEAALRTSSLIVLSSDGKKVKRLHPLPFVEERNVKPQTVLAENLPADHSEDNIRRIFGTVGRIVEVTIHDPLSKEASATQNKDDLAISKKLHALIEYDTVEAAESAVSTLNDESNWSGMRVQLLLKRMAKYGRYGLSQRGQKDVPLEKNGMKQEEKKLINVGMRRSRTKGRGQHHQPTCERGAGSLRLLGAWERRNRRETFCSYSSSSSEEEAYWSYRLF